MNKMVEETVKNMIQQGERTGKDYICLLYTSMDQIETGISLGGIISGVPSSKYGQKYRTGFGTKYANKTDVIKLAEKYNALVQVGDTGNPFYSCLLYTS